MNVFQMVKSCISAISQEEIIRLYTFVEQENILGKVEPIYSQPHEFSAHIQIIKDEINALNEDLRDSQTSLMCYLNINGVKPSALNTIRQVGGDIIQRSDNTCWLITQVIDDFVDLVNNRGFISLRAELYTQEFEATIRE